MLSAKIKHLLKLLLPPALTGAIRHIRHSLNPSMEFIPGEWPVTPSSIANGNGWDVKKAASGTSEERKRFQQDLAGAAPFGIEHEHNLHVTFAYVLALVARNQSRISVLDWGAGLGQYFHLANAALPRVEIEYHCKDMPALAREGARVSQGAHWHDSDDCLTRSYSMVFASGSFQYVRDWRIKLAELANASAEFLFLTRVPIVKEAQSFAVRQQVYGSQMVFWVFNRTELIDAVTHLGFKLEREFLVQDWPWIKGSPEQAELRGWLFRRIAISSSQKDKP